MSKKILVTGGAGWLGSAIVRALLRRGDEVVATDLAISPAVSDLAMSHPGLATAAADLGEWHQVVGLFQRHRPDAVIHTAAIVGVVQAADTPIKALRATVEGSINLFEAMRLSGVRRVVHISTEETYGDFLAPTIDEEHPQRPVSVYGLTELRCKTGAGAHRARWIGDVLLAQARHRGRTDADRKHARPADVGERIDELAFAGRRACRIGSSQRQHGHHQPGGEPAQGVAAKASMRRRLPSCVTKAGTCVMPSLPVSAPCWS